MIEFSKNGGWSDTLVQSVFIIGIVLAVVISIIGSMLGKAPKTGFNSYYPGLLLFTAGLIFLAFASLADRTYIMDASLGGWGIACLFAAIFGTVIASILDAFQQGNRNA